MTSEPLHVDRYQRRAYIALGNELRWLHRALTLAMESAGEARDDGMLEDLRGLRGEVRRLQDSWEDEHGNP